MRDEAIVAAWGRVRNFIAEELECRTASMLPTSDTGDRSYIDSAKAALRAADQLGVHLGSAPGGLAHNVFNCPVCGTAKCRLPERGAN